MIDGPVNLTPEMADSAQPPAESEEKPSPECIDKLTALEMLQLLKEYKSNNTNPYYPILDQFQVALYDPAVNLEVKTLRSKLYEQALELRKTQDELKAATYSSESVMGRRLINKCKALQEENTDIGKMLLENQLQPLQIQTNVLEKQLTFFKQQLKVLYEMNADLDDENERLTRQVQELTILYKNCQQERDTANAKLEKLTEKKSSSTKEKQSSSYRRSSSRDSYRNRKNGGNSARHHTKSDTRKETSRRSVRRNSRRDTEFTKRSEKKKNPDNTSRI